MKTLFTLIFVFTLQQVLAQNIINIGSDTTDGTFKIDKKIKSSLTLDKEYKIKISGLNPAHTSVSIKSHAKEIYYPIPEIVKSVIPGITGSVRTGGTQSITDDDTFKDISKKFENLTFIKSLADSLHKATLFKPDTALAKRLCDSVKSKFPSLTEQAIADSLSSDIQFLLSAETIADELIKNNTGSFSNYIISSYALIKSIGKELKAKNYNSYFTYIVKSKSKSTTNYIVSKPFTAAKDLVELNITLIDTYSKDTLVNEIKTFYTKGGKSFGLSFSSGFFYTEMLSDKPYYLKSRPDENVTVLPDRQAISDISIGGLGHLYYKISPFTRIAASLGIAVSPFDGKSRYLLGGSLLLGKEKMLSISAGSAWAKVKELSSLVQTDNQGMYLPKGTTSVPTIDRIKNSLFIGLTYNISSTRK